MNELAPVWRRELAWGGLAAVLFAIPSLVGQVALGRVLGKAAELAALLSLGSSSRMHLLLGPLDAALGGIVRLGVLAVLVWLLAWALLGVRVSFRGTLAAVGRAARVLAWGPVLFAALAGGAAWVWFLARAWAGDPGLWELAYGAMKGWLALQGVLWLWVLLRFARALEREHGIRRAEALLLGLAPAWALLATLIIEGWLP